MHSPLDGHIIVSELDFARLTRLLEQHDSTADALGGELERALLLRPSAVPGNVVTMNSEVEYEDVETQVRQAVRIVYPRDADASRGWISVLAPIGTALLGLRTGQSIRWRTPAGYRNLRVLEIRYQPEAAGHFQL
jgi:regulator of nucleoside diphosphate kinase